MYELRPSKVRRTCGQVHCEYLHTETALPLLPLTQFLFEGYRNRQGTLTAWKDADQIQTQPLRAPQTQ